MCNRVSTPTMQQIKELLEGYDMDEESEEYLVTEHTTGFEKANLPILTHLHPAKVRAARWGYLPPTARHENELANYDTLNARCESLFTSQLYNEAAKDRRCIIFVNGFFEFKHKDRIKYPHYITKEDGRTFAFGGIYSQWNDIRTCSIITTPANALLTDIHNQKLRMPFVIGKNDWAQWLDHTQLHSDIEDMMQPYPIEDLIAWQVSGLLTTRGANTNLPEVKEAIGPKFKSAPFPDPIPKLIPKPKDHKTKQKTPPDHPQLGLF